MQQTIVGCFSTRRDAELAVEHLVQAHGVERRAISVRASGEANSAGTKKAGADVESSHSDAGERGMPELNGPIEVAVACTGRANDREAIEAAFKEVGAKRMRRH